MGLRSSQLSVQLQEATSMHNAKVISYDDDYDDDDYDDEDEDDEDEAWLMPSGPLFIVDLDKCLVGILIIFC